MPASLADAPDAATAIVTPTTARHANTRADLAFLIGLRLHRRIGTSRAPVQMPAGRLVLRDYLSDRSNSQTGDPAGSVVTSTWMAPIVRRFPAELYVLIRSRAQSQRTPHLNP